MENKIKITVEYEKPEMSKLDALMEQYVIAEKIADTTIADIKPVIEECGRAKYKAICEQLELIGKKLRQFCLMGKRINTPYIEVWYEEYTRFKIKYDYEKDELRYLYNVGTFNDGASFMWEANYKHLTDTNGLVTKWNNYDIINKLNKDLERLIERSIESQLSRANGVKKHLENMLK